MEKEESVKQRDLLHNENLNVLMVATFNGKTYNVGISIKPEEINEKKISDMLTELSNCVRYTLRKKIIIPEAG